MVAFVHDLRRRAAEEAERINARDRAVAGEHVKTCMFADMANEMCTPSNGVLELLGVTKLDDRQRQYVAAMAHSGRMLLGQVNDLLDSSRARSGQLGLAQNPVDLRARIDAAIQGLQTRAPVAGNRLTAAYPVDDLWPVSLPWSGMPSTS